MGIILRSLWSLLRWSLWQVLATSVLIWWLIFLANILMTVSYNTEVASSHIQPKLWMYFYLNQWLDEEVEGQTVMSMVEELKEAGLDASFYTKQQAFARLSQHLPWILSDFENYWIDNPLPPTLYVLFADDESYQTMKSIIVRYDWLISNSADLTDWMSFSDQEQRIQTTINAMNVITQWSLILVTIIVATIIAFLWYALSATITKFREQLLVEKLLWAYGWQITVPFLLYALLLVCGWFALFLLAGYWAITILDWYSLELFKQSFMSLALPWEWMLADVLLYELWALIWVTLLASFCIVSVLLRRV